MPYRSRDGKVAARKWPFFERVYPYLERIRAAMKVRDQLGQSHLSVGMDARPVKSPSSKRTGDLRVADRLYCMV